MLQVIKSDGTSLSDGSIQVIDKSGYLKRLLPATSSAYTHSQAIPSAIWTIPHNLGFKPNVNVIDSGGNNVIGDISHTSVNIMVITFAASFGGEAYLS